MFEKSKIIQGINDALLAEVKAEVPESLTSLTADDSSRNINYLLDVLNYCRKRNSLSPAIGTGSCFFILVSPDQVQYCELLGAPKSGLTKDLSFVLNNKLIISLSPNLSKNRYIDCSDQDEDLTWESLYSKLQSIQSIYGLNLPYAIFNQELGTVDLYPEGESSDKSWLVNLNEQQIKFSRADLENFSEQFHQQETATPLGYMRIWTNQEEYELLPDAEDRIVRRFVPSLEIKIGKNNVVYEGSGPAGRVDVFIHQSAMIDEHGPCVLEFKLLRPKDALTKSRKWIWKGIFQARDYSKEKRAKSSYVMAYDARINREPLPLVDALCNRHNVIFKQYVMRNTTSKNRDEEVEQTEAAYKANSSK